jgi:hypothetical protein
MAAMLSIKPVMHMPLDSPSSLERAIALRITPRIATGKLNQLNQPKQGKKPMIAPTIAMIPNTRLAIFLKSSNFLENV